MNESAWVKATSILDAYSRILMGQFSIIYEVLDIADTDNKPQLQAYHDARWGGVGIAEARDLLIPQLRKLRGWLEWNGNFGISNVGLTYNSKLAYEMLKAILYVCGQGGWHGSEGNRRAVDVCAREIEYPSVVKCF